MKIRCVVLIASLFALFVSVPMTRAFAGRAGDRMDLPLRMLVETPDAGKAMLGKAVSLRAGIEQADVLIKSRDAQATAAAIDDAGGGVHSVVGPPAGPPACPPADRRASRRAGSIMTAFVPVRSLTDIAALEEVDAVEASRPMNLLMDTARSTDNTGVVQVQSDFDGTNVVVGAIDSGLDYSRADFAESGSATGTRVEYMRFQSVGSGSVSVVECAKDLIDAGSCSIGPDNDSAIGHGTHVTGIAAGSDSKYTGIAPAADIMFVRNDFIDDLSEGGGTFSGGVIDGVVEIFKKSDIIDKPAVINLSQGTHIGAHDDTSLLEQALDSAVQGGYAAGGKDYGRAIVAAAGNEGIVDAVLGAFANNAGGIHVPISVGAGESAAWRLWVLDSAAPGRTPLVADAWFGTGQGGNCIIAANAYQYPEVFDAGTTNPKAGAITTDASAAIADTPLATDASNQASNADVAITLATDSSDAQNQRPRAIIQFGPGGEATWQRIAVSDNGVANLNFYLLDIIVRASGDSCTGDIWLEGGGTYAHFMKNIDTGTVGDGSSGGGYGLASGDSQKIVTIPATASGVIAVGAYLQKKPVSGCSGSCWTDVDGNRHDATDPAAPDASQALINGGVPGDRAPFSSGGPAAYSYSGRKPEVLAPGDPIISVLPTGFTPMSGGVANDFVIVDATHYKLQGTSQASPQVAGIVALLFQKNNRLTAERVKQALTSTAVTTSNPDQDGFGKVMAPAAFASIGFDTSGYAGTDDLKQSDLDSGDGGGGGTAGGCGGMLVPSAPGDAASSAIVLLLPLIFILLPSFVRRG
ncbi:MAG: S8 family serine peptidase [bacterium]